MLEINRTMVYAASAYNGAYLQAWCLQGCPLVMHGRPAIAVHEIL